MHEFLFYLYACFVAPFHFNPKKCYVKHPEKCRIWNCRYHYKNEKYDDCQKYCRRNCNAEDMFTRES